MNNEKTFAKEVFPNTINYKFRPTTEFTRDSTVNERCSTENKAEF